MPTDESVLGFRNTWYKLAMQTAIEYFLPNGREIRLINAPLFLCTKLEAFSDRGKNDFLMSSDIEDIILVINGRDELVGECRGMPLQVRKYLADSFHNLLESQEFLYALPSLLPYFVANREEIVLACVKQLAELSTS